MANEIYVIVDSVTGDFVLGGGSSTPARIHGYATRGKAEGASKRIGTWNLTGKPVVARFVRDET